MVDAGQMTGYDLGSHRKRSVMTDTKMAAILLVSSGAIFSSLGFVALGLTTGTLSFLCVSAMLASIALVSGLSAYFLRKRIRRAAPNNTEASTISRKSLVLSASSSTAPIPLQIPGAPYIPSNQPFAIV